MVLRQTQNLLLRFYTSICWPLVINPLAISMYILSERQPVQHAARVAVLPRASEAGACARGAARLLRREAQTRYGANIHTGT